METATPVAEASKEEQGTAAEEGMEAANEAENENTQDVEAPDEAVTANEEVLPTSSQPEVALNSDAEDQEQEMMASDAQPEETAEVESSLNPVLCHAVRSVAWNRRASIKHDSE